MAYPFWDAPIGYGVLMALVSVLHVFVSHFAIGGGLYLVVSETLARRAGDNARLAFLQQLSRFFALVTLVTGALTGVAIWFIIGLLNPTATEVLIHNYVWAWATEWTFFVVEITAAILYFYGWKRMEARAHMAIGWIYFISAWLSLFVINGIITLMLTPGRWLTTGNFWDGFFNPTFWPSLVLRTGVSLMLACLYALLVASFQKTGEFKARTVRYTAKWGAAGLAITAASQYWYWKAIPADVTTRALQFMRTPIQSIHYSAWLLGAITLLLLVFGFLLPRRLPRTVAVLLMALGLAWFGAFEFFRESIRKPYVIHGYLYGNGLDPARGTQYTADGYLANISYTTGDDGADLFRHACRSCHTISGYKPLKPAFDGTDTTFIATMIRSAHIIRGNMPPFVGRPDDLDKLAAYIYSQVDHRSLAEIHGVAGLELGRKVYATRCGNCHVVGGYKDKSESLSGLSADEINGLLDNAADLGDGMPAYSGDATERAALVAYLQTLGPTPAGADSSKVTQ